MPAPRIPKGITRPKREPRPGMSPMHLDLVRQLPCCVCGLYGYDVQPHHLLRTGEHGMGRKSSDRWAVSLCRVHHDGLHADGDEEAYLAYYGIDGRALAQALWRYTGDLERMQAAVWKARTKG